MGTLMEGHGEAATVSPARGGVVKSKEAKRAACGTKSPPGAGRRAASDFRASMDTATAPPTRADAGPSSWLGMDDAL
jgi:hypothetical protein